MNFPRQQSGWRACLWAMGVGVIVFTIPYSGCNNPGTDKQTQQLSVGPGSFIADVPVPQGFRLDEKRSMNRSYQTVRWLDHYYDGKQDLMAVRNFYMAQLPVQKWEITADTLSEGAYTIRCKKGVERCDITIGREKQDSLWSSVRIHVVLEPQQAPTGNGALTQEPRDSGKAPDEP